MTAETAETEGAGAALLADFEADRLDPAKFRHADHIRVAFELLKRRRFLDAAIRYEDGLKALTARAGVPQKYNLTITLAFLALISERFANDPYASWEDFSRENAFLFERTCLARWYAPARLAAPEAKTHFLLPDPA